ncbi:unnamed protein product [Durusdinium trenchii]|uniref:Clusterin-associated protein 1 n=1 Tax=Durusdinium trenchii TaxID=1381693 RepID=A0ABP0R2H4_9DINO
MSMGETPGTPNFELVADILDWLLHRFEPGIHIPDDISTETHRVHFIKSVVEKVVLKTGLKLNPKKLYGADGYAVKELLRLASVLYEAQKSVGDVAPGEPRGEDFALNSKLADLKSTRSLCSQIVESGAMLFELLQKEQEVRQDREKALTFLDGMSRNLGSERESEMVETAVKQLLGNHGQNLEQLKQMSDELQRDEKSLEQKIKKKKQELDRCRKRLGSLASVRPAFMDEYEQLEQELERFYEQYVGRFRNLDYLEHEIDELNKEEQDRMEENDRALKRMQKRLRDEEWRLLRGEEDEKGKPRKPKKIHGQKRWMPPSAVDAVDGSMEAGDDEESSPESGSSDPPISVGSEDSGPLAGGAALGGLGDRERAVSPPEGSVAIGGGNSVSEDDILDESEEDELSDQDLQAGRPPPGSDFDF